MVKVARTEQAWRDVFAAADGSASELGQMVNTLGAIGGGANGEVSRLAFMPAERAAHALVGGWLAEAGFEVRADTFGNLIAERPGTVAGLAPIAFGSHADSVPNGGRFDGAAGVLVATRLAQLVGKANLRTQHPLRIVVFANEEGARFGEPCLGSKAVIGDLTPEAAEVLVDADGVTLAAAMVALGFDSARIPEARWRRDEIDVFFEVHVEQGRVLETRGLDIGLVDVVAGSARIRVELRGRSDHSGGTPMSLRRDALVGAAEVILLIERQARRYPSGSVGTVGRLQVHPNNITTVPGAVTLYLDIRDVDALRREESVVLAREGVEQIARGRGLAAEFTVIAHTPPVHLWAWAREFMKAACRQVAVGWRVMPSGAGHDAQILAHTFPTAMLFVPSRDGASHVPAEWTDPSQLAVGLHVLARAIALADSR